MQIEQGKPRVLTYIRERALEPKPPWQVTCSREQNGCKRCTKSGISCIYSRSGVIRRAKKRKHETQQARDATSQRLTQTDDGSTPKIIRSDSGLQSYLASDIEMTQECLGGSKTADQRGPSDALLILTEACTATPVDREPTLPESGKSRKRTRLWFKKYASRWSESVHYIRAANSISAADIAISF